MPRWQAITIRVAVILASIGAGSLLPVGGAGAAERGSIPWFAAMPEMELAEFVLDCRTDTRKADGWACRNAEAALSRLYARLLRRSRFAHLRSPLFWAENPYSARAVKAACARPTPHNESLRAYCRYIPDGIT